MNIRPRNYLCLSIIAAMFVPSIASANDADASAKAHQHYRCSALVELGRMTNENQKVCDELLAGGFDLAAWEAGNRDQSLKLQEEVFAEFF